MLETGCDNYKEEKDIQICHKKWRNREEFWPRDEKHNTTVLFILRGRNELNYTGFQFLEFQYLLATDEAKIKKKPSTTAWVQNKEYNVCLLFIQLFIQCLVFSYRR